MATKILIRRDSFSNFTSVNPILGNAEMSYITDTGRMKIGDGVTEWNSLPYFLPAIDDEFNRLDEKLENSDADEMLVYDTVIGEYNKMTRRNFLKFNSLKIVDLVESAKLLKDMEEDDLIFIIETRTAYRYVESYDGGLIADNKHIISTFDGSNTRWLGVFGQYMVEGLNLAEGSVYKINNVQVVGERQSDIAGESGIAGGTYGNNEQNMMNGMKDKINDILKALRAHGLIG